MEIVVKCQMQFVAQIYLQLSLSPSSSQHPSLLFPAPPRLLCFCTISCLLCLSLFTLLMLVEGLRANTVNITGFKALQMSYYFFFFQSTITKPRLQQICQLQVQGQVLISQVSFQHATAVNTLIYYDILKAQIGHFPTRQN